MTSNGSDIAEMADPALENALEELAKLEKDFAAVEIDTMRQREYSLKELYDRRQKHISSIPDFWPTVLINGPEEITSQLGPQDGPILDSITSMKVERYQIKSGAEGEPRSLRFTFTFDTSKNPFFEDATVVKEFEFVNAGSVSGLVSRPVNFKWTREGRKAGMNRVLDLSEGLWLAEQALVGSGERGSQGVAIERAEREGLWQYEKLREELEKEEDEPVETSFLEWFGYRGVVEAASEAKVANGDAEESDEDNGDDDDDGTLEVEIFPAGEEVANALAEDLWPNVMDFYIQAQDDEDLDVDIEGESDDEDAPELVEAADFEGFEEEDKRPSKKQRKS